ncbi:pF165R [African swine fever virus]|uniref:BA71V-F165R n=1 Tax=African swine fever virus TaxID=10497 RepID=A0A0C5AZX8_ASF|nr:BA71V-F165R [African swine fever virus]UYB79201.1 pF165R [Recombinant African swine fever virus]AJL34225.1 BA71V-F165R [African swine fever virus]AXB49275.1 pF165R [African swine fever virus]AXB49449.1 pF165R [African swine fever virus]AXB49621.1 pF165R [African swine fever virus]
MANPSKRIMNKKSKQASISSILNFFFFYIMEYFVAVDNETPLGVFTSMEQCEETMKQYPGLHYVVFKYTCPADAENTDVVYLIPSLTLHTPMFVDHCPNRTKQARHVLKKINLVFEEESIETWKVSVNTVFPHVHNRLSAPKLSIDEANEAVEKFLIQAGRLMSL